MNASLLRNAVQVARNMPHALDMLTTWEATELSAYQENKLSVGKLREYFYQGQLRCDIATIIALLTLPASAPAAPSAIQDAVMREVQCNLFQYENLIYFPLWPRQYSEPYRAARQAPDHEGQVETLAAYVEHFIKTNGLKHNG